MRKAYGKYVVLGVLALALLLGLLLAGGAAAWPKAGEQPMTKWAIAGGMRWLPDGTAVGAEVWANDAAPAAPTMQLYVEWIWVRWLSEDEGELLGAATGEARLAAPSLRGSGLSLTRTSLKATVPMTDELSGAPWGDAQVDLVWTGLGPITSESFHGLLVDEETGMVYRLNHTGRGRDASVAGTIAFPDGSTLSGEDLRGILWGGISVYVPK